MQRTKMTSMKNIKLIFIAIIFSFSNSAIILFAQTKGKEVLVGSFAPPFLVKDIEGNSHSIEQYKGKKILLSFYRNVGCPVCNLRFHQLEEERKYFEEKGIVLLAVYESSSENLKNYVDTNHYFQKMIANPSADLYELYGVEESRGKIIKGVMNGAIKKSKNGKKLYTTKVEKDGSTNRIAADFLINEQGNIMVAYYGNYLGDRMPIAQIKEKIANK